MVEAADLVAEALAAALDRLDAALDTAALTAELTDAIVAEFVMLTAAMSETLLESTDDTLAATIDTLDIAAMVDDMPAAEGVDAGMVTPTPWHSLTAKSLVAEHGETIH